MPTTLPSAPTGPHIPTSSAAPVLPERPRGSAPSSAAIALPAHAQGSASGLRGVPGTHHRPSRPPAAGKAKRPSRIARNARFLREFVKAPGVVAAVAPSSRFLAREMIRGLDLGACRTIVEYGPGSGAFTVEIERALPAGWIDAQTRNKLIAIELNRPIAEMFRLRHPEVRLHCDSAANVLDIARREGVEPGEVDLIVSGLGWPSFSDHLRTEILQATVEALRPGGEFRTFGYHCGLLMRGAWHFRKEIKRLFSRVSMSPVIWRNAPPAFVYRCVK